MMMIRMILSQRVVTEVMMVEMRLRKEGMRSIWKNLRGSSAIFQLRSTVAFCRPKSSCILKDYTFIGFEGRHSFRLRS